ncbi:HDIG domain-containing protein [Halobacillus fulvus]|nr:HDIG domain-containing protein [Halobacillus fulvus]
MTNNRKSPPNKKIRKAAAIFIPPLLIALLFFMSSISNVHTQTYQLEKYGTAPETIVAPITIENEQETEQRIREVMQSVEDRYTISNTITDERLQIVEEIYEVVEEVKQTSIGELPVTEQLDQLEALLSEDITTAFPVEFFRPLLTNDGEDIEESERILVTTLETAFEKGIRAQTLDQEQRSLELRVEYSTIPASLQDVISRLGTFVLTENALFDPRATEEAIKEAVSNVDPVMIRAGEIIVDRGATITNDVYEELVMTGLLDNNRNHLPLIGLALFALLLASIIFNEIYREVKRGRMNLQHIYVLTLITVLMIFLMKGFSLFVTIENPVYYLMPAATGVFLIKFLLKERLAIVMSVVYSLMAALLFNGEMTGVVNAEAGIYMALSQLAAVYLLFQTRDRMAILKASVGVAFINICTILFFLFLSFEPFAWSELFLFGAYAAGSAFAAAVLTLGLLPFIETWFGLLSDHKLVQLANPNQPLLRKILMEAPGSYHHSIMVANLSEAACEAIDANGLLARVGAYYHDLGKTVRPHYFIENQMGMKNPHDFIPPEESAEIILRHPYDGAGLLEKNHLPKEIVDIARQHHGTTLLKYFYYQAKENDGDIEESMYRYPGPKPQSKEAAVVCVCDSVEAAVRSIDRPTEEKIKKIVHSIIEDRLLDGQFDDCDLTFKEINKMEYAICETLNGIFHSRIQYPDLIKEAK